MKKKSSPPKAGQAGSFGKFAQKKSNAAIKEQFRQEKKKPSSAADLRPLVSGIMPLNKFIAHAGVCARREAAEMVKKGLVKVNNQLVTEPGHKVSAKDDIRVNGKKIFLAKNLVYILLNKPKDYITTTDDPQKRKTVLDLVGRATHERVYPVGRLAAGQKYFRRAVTDQ
jgi:23S rRNA pseudouridine2605 synthase